MVVVGGGRLIFGRAYFGRLIIGILQYFIKKNANSKRVFTKLNNSSKVLKNTFLSG